MSIKFDWDPRKARGNLRKHGIDFNEASTVFADRLTITIPDPDHSEDAERWVTIGFSLLPVTSQGAGSLTQFAQRGDLGDEVLLPPGIGLGRSEAIFAIAKGQPAVTVVKKFSDPKLFPK